MGWVGEKGIGKGRGRRGKGRWEGFLRSSEPSKIRLYNPTKTHQNLIM